MRSSITLRFSARRSSSSPVPATGNRPPRSPRMIVACCFRHRIDASQDAAGDEKSAGETKNDHDRNRPTPGRKHDIVETLALVEIAPDQQTETARQLEDAHKRVMFRMIGSVRFVEPSVDGLRPARIVECAGRQSRDIAGEGLSRKCRDEIKAGAGTPRAGVDDNYEPPDARPVDTVRRDR